MKKPIDPLPFKKMLRDTAKEHFLYLILHFASFAEDNEIIEEYSPRGYARFWGKIWHRIHRWKKEAEEYKSKYEAIITFLNSFNVVMVRDKDLIQIKDVLKEIGNDQSKSTE